MVLCPTRELADQVTTEIRRLARAEDNIKVVTLCGGVALRGQIASLEHGAHIVVGTPGRIMDHLERGNLNLEALNTLVLDEADRMLDMGFFDDIATVAKQCPKERQTLLFSATYPEGIAKLSQQFMRNPQTDQGAGAARRKARSASAGTRSNTDHDEARLHAVAQLLNHYRPVSTLAFCNTKQQCRDLVQRAARTRASARWRCMASWSSASATRCWCSLPTAAARCWWPPTWPRAGWTSRSWKRSSTSM